MAGRFRSTLRGGVMLLAFGVVGVAASPALAQTPPVPGAPESTASKTFVTLPDTGPTENICQQKDGTIYVTMLNDKKVVKITPAGQVSDFALFPKAYVVIGVACGPDEVAVSYFANYNRDKDLHAVYTNTGTHLMFYDLAGKLKADVMPPPAVAINGFDYGDDGVYYGGDSGSGTLQRIDPKTHAITPFWSDPSFGPPGGVGTGINGIRSANGWVYFSGPQKHGLFKVKIGPGGKSVGGAVPVELGVGVDDFDVAKDGSVYFSSGRVLYKVAPDGAMTIIADPVPGGPSALVSNDGKTVYWPTRTGVDHERVMQVAIP